MLENRVSNLEAMISKLTSSVSVEKEDVDNPYYMYVTLTPYEGERYAREKLYNTFYKKSEAFKAFDNLKCKSGKGNDWGGEARLVHKGENVRQISWDRWSLYSEKGVDYGNTY